MMYFSGCAGKSEVDILVSAGVDRVLVDRHDYPNVAGKFTSIALDSGAYRAFKSGTALDIDAYLAFVDQTPDLDFFVAPDVIGNPDATLQNWTRYRRPGMLPVYQWGAPEAHLMQYLDEAPTVGIGGLVQPMREKHEPTLRALSKIVKAHPGRLHVFGLNWPKAIGHLDPLLSSHDSSTWLKAGRYGHVFFINTRTGRPQSCPAKILGKGDLDRKQRLLESAEVLNTWCNAA